MSNNKCDECNGPMPVIVGVWQRRPSDPTDLCSILWLCTGCAERQGWTGGELPGDTVPGLGTYHQVETWVEEHGMLRRSDPVLFLT